MKKINSIHFGLKWITASLVVGGVIPFVYWLLFHQILWYLIALGALSLVAFAVVLSIEMKQDFGKVPYYQKHLKSDIPFDPLTQKAVIKCSIDGKEMMAGFRNKKDGSFTEVMVIRSEEDKKSFASIYSLDKIDIEYFN